MARIRSIKPEFPQSESMGRVSRDARLLFVMLWTLADDAGRLRGNSRMLASLLFPYDDDAKGLMDGWLAELQDEGCIDSYKVDGDSYIEIRNWLIHQKIDKPSKSKIPAFDEDSRTFAKPRELSSGDLRKGSKDQGEDQRIEGSGEPTAKPDGSTATEETNLQMASRETWRLYSLAYLNRYGTEPVRNAKVNSQIKQLVQALSHEEAPQVAAFFVSMNDQFFVKRCHPVDILLTQCSAIRTQWATGTQITTTKAMQIDKSQTNAGNAEDAAQIVLQMRRGRGSQNA